MKIIRTWDNGGKTFDRYTVLVEGNDSTEYEMLGMSDNPLSPQGFNQYCGTVPVVDVPMYEEAWGKPVKFNELPQEVQEAIKKRVK